MDFISDIVKPKKDIIFILVIKDQVIYQFSRVVFHSHWQGVSTEMRKVDNTWKEVSSVSRCWNHGSKNSKSKKATEANEV